MIDIIGHFFVLYPIFTLIKDSNKLTKSTLLKFVASLFLLLVAAGFTRVYLMDTTVGNRKENLYEIMEMKPNDFFDLEKDFKRTFKRKYHDLSRKYHPDKNENDTTDLFMKLKTAYEILNDQQKRVHYDVYGTTDFSMDERME